MLIVHPCRSDKTRAGMARHAHLADGRIKLVLVARCSPLQYLRFLLAMSRSGCVPGQLPYVRVVDAVAVQVLPGGGELSSWNCDGEIVAGPDMRLAAECHHALLRVFARGVEP
jgi:ceramide kinase